MAGLVEKLQKMWNPPDDEYDEYYEDEPEQEQESSRSSYSEPPALLPAIPSRTSRPAANPPGETGWSISTPRPSCRWCSSSPSPFGEETRAIADEAVKAPHRGAQPGKDREGRLPPDCGLLSGVAYANNGKIQRIATNTFIITPYNVDLTGDDVLDELENNGLYF